MWELIAQLFRRSPANIVGSNNLHVYQSFDHDSPSHSFLFQFILGGLQQHGASLILEIRSIVQVYFQCPVRGRQRDPRSETSDSLPAEIPRKQDVVIDYNNCIDDTVIWCDGALVWPPK